MATILLVEDEANQRLLYQIELEEEGHEVVVAESGGQALRRVEEVQPDLVVLDLRMPEMDGISVLERMMDMNPRLPVVIHSGYERFKDHFMTWAADAYVVKNSNPNVLKGAIDRVLLERGMAGQTPAGSPDL